MRSSREFEDEIARRYGEFEANDGKVGKGPGRQVWHTPTELFKVSWSACCVWAEWQLMFRA